MAKNHKNSPTKTSAPAEAPAAPTEAQATTEAPAAPAAPTEAPAAPTEAQATTEAPDPHAALRASLAGIGLAGAALEAALQGAIQAQATEARNALRGKLESALTGLTSPEPVTFSLTIGPDGPVVIESGAPRAVPRVRAARQGGGFTRGGEPLEILGEGAMMEGTYRGKRFEAAVWPNGQIEVLGVGLFSGVSAASLGAIRTVNPDAPSSNGWEFWKVDGKKIADLRK